MVIDFQYLGLCFSGFLIRGRSHLEHGFQRQNASVHWVVNKRSRHDKTHDAMQIRAGRIVSTEQMWNWDIFSNDMRHHGSRLAF